MRRSRARRHRRSSLAGTLAGLRPATHLIATGIVLGVALLAPFPLASVEWRWICLWAIMLGFATPLLDYNAMTRQQLRFLACVIAASALLLLYMLLQATATHGLLPEHRLFRETRQLLGRPMTGYASATPDQSLLVAGGFALSLLAFAASFVACSKPVTARVFLVAIAIMGTVNGILGVYLHHADPRHLLWMTFDAPKGQPSGTFVSRNHAVTLFACCTVIFFTLALHRLLGAVPRGAMPLKSRLMIMMLNEPPRVGAFLLMLIACLALTLATGSRGGLLALLCGLLTVYALLVIRMAGMRLGVMLAGGGALVGVVFLSQVGLGAVGARFAEMRLGEDGRAEIYRAIVKMIADSPWFGFGTGSFEFTLPRYRPDSISPRLIWDYAHSSPLQLIVELGIPAALLGLGILLSVIGLCVRGAFLRRRHQDLPVIGAGVGVVGLSHSLIDFPLQIPGFMLVFAVALGAAAAQSFPTWARSEASAAA